MALSLFFGSTPLVSEPHATVLLRSLRLALLSGALFSMSPAMALDAVVVAGKTCPAHTTPVTYQGPSPVRGNSARRWVSGSSRGSLAAALSTALDMNAGCARTTAATWAISCARRRRPARRPARSPELAARRQGLRAPVSSSQPTPGASRTSLRRTLSPSRAGGFRSAAPSGRVVRASARARRCRMSPGTTWPPDQPVRRPILCESQIPRRSRGGGDSIFDLEPAAATAGQVRRRRLHLRVVGFAPWPKDGAIKKKGRLSSRPFCVDHCADQLPSSVQVAEEEEDQDDRQRDADQPEKTTLHHGETSSSSAEQRASPRPVPCSSLTWPSFAPRRCRPPVGGLNPAHDRPEDPPHRPCAAQSDRRRRRRQRREGARGALRGGRARCRRGHVPRALPRRLSARGPRPEARLPGRLP